MPWVDGFSPAIVLLFALTCVHMAVALGLFIKWRSLYPLNARKLGLVMTGVAALFLWELGDMFNSLLDWSCPFILVTLQYGIILAGTVLLLRGWWVWFAFYAATEKVKLAEDRNDPKWRNRWFQRHVHWVTTSSMLRAAAVIFLLEIIPPSIAFYFATLEADYDPLETLCPALNVSTTLLTVTTALKVGFGGYTAYKIRNANDGFYIKKELGVLTGVAILALLVGNVNRLLEFNPHHVRPILWCFRNLMVVITLDTPVYLAYRAQKTDSMTNLYSLKNASANHESRQDEPIDDKPPTDEKTQKHLTVPTVHGNRARQNSYTINLKDVMGNPSAAKLFRDHLVTEFSAENYLFYDETGEFERRCESGAYASIQERNLAAAEICAEYIDSDGASQVNLPATSQRQVLEIFDECIEGFEPSKFQRHLEERPAIVCIQEIPDDVFLDARRRIFSLMEKDSFQRFRMVARRKLKDYGTELVHVSVAVEV